MAKLSDFGGKLSSLGGLLSSNGGRLSNFGSGVSASTQLPQSSNIIAQWSADSLALNDGEAVGSWVDSINNIEAAQSTGLNKPIFKTNILGEKPSVRFNGTSSKLGIATPGALKTAFDSKHFTVMIVFKRNADAGGFGTLFGYQDGGSQEYYIADNGRLHRYAMGGASSSIPYTSYTDFTTFGNTSGDGGELNIETGLERAYVNGSCVHGEIAFAVSGACDNFSIGYSVSNNFYVNADIFEIVAWDVELTPAECLQFHGWACEKYSQTKPWESLTNFYVFDGDSITMGTGSASVSSASPAKTYPYKTAQSLSLTYGQWSNTGIGYRDLVEMNSKFASDVGAIATASGKPLIVSAFEFYNSRLHADPQAEARAYISTVKASGATLVWGSSTDHFGSPDTARETYNASFDSDHAAVDVYVPIHTDEFIGVDLATEVHSDHFAADKVHLIEAGYTVLASLMAAGINAIP
jgi:hypothetical protein